MCAKCGALENNNKKAQSTFPYWHEAHIQAKDQENIFHAGY